MILEVLLFKKRAFDGADATLIMPADPKKRGDARNHEI